MEPKVQNRELSIVLANLPGGTRPLKDQMVPPHPLEPKRNGTQFIKNNISYLNQMKMI